jgi:hypothetical protein
VPYPPAIGCCLQNGGFQVSGHAHGQSIEAKALVLQVCVKLAQMPQRKSLSFLICGWQRYGHQAPQRYLWQCSYLSTKFRHLVWRCTTVVAVVYTDLHAHVKRAHMFRPLLAEPPGNFLAIDCLYPIEIFRQRPGFVGLHPAYEMPGNLLAALRNLLQRFLQVVFTHICQPCGVSFVNCINAMALANGEN